MCGAANKVPSHISKMHRPRNRATSQGCLRTESADTEVLGPGAAGDLARKDGAAAAVVVRGLDFLEEPRPNSFFMVLCCCLVAVATYLVFGSR